MSTVGMLTVQKQDYFVQNTITDDAVAREHGGRSAEGPAGFWVVVIEGR